MFLSKPEEHFIVSNDDGYLFESISSVDPLTLLGTAAGHVLDAGLPVEKRLRHGCLSFSVISRTMDIW